MKPIRVHLAADRELEEIGDYYTIEKGSPETAEDFANEMERVFALVTENPQIGTPIKRGLRSFTIDRFPYNLIYRDEPGYVYVLAIAHHRKQPMYWLPRLD